MNDKIPFERAIADKLQDLPVPDRDGSWTQMRSLLDDKMPQTGGGGAGGIGFKPFGRLWWAGAVAVLITTVVWFMAENHRPSRQFLSPENNIALENRSTRNEKPANNIPAEKPSLNQGQGPVTQNNNRDGNGGKINPSTATVPSDNANLRVVQNGVANDDSRAKEKVENGITLPPTSDRITIASATHGSAIVPSLVKSKSKGRDRRSSTISGRRQRQLAATNRLLNSPDNSNTSATRNRYTPNRRSTLDNVVATRARSRGTHPIVRNKDGEFHATRKSGQRNNDVVSVSVDLKQKQKKKSDHSTLQNPVDQSLYRLPNGLVVLHPNNVSGFDTANKIDAPVFSLAAPLTDAEKRALRKSVRKEHPSAISEFLSNLSLPYGGESWWAAGFSLNASFKTGSQQSTHFNASGTKSLLTDYLPSPYLQYHINSNLYVQSELNFIAPQHTPSLLVYRGEKQNFSQQRYLESQYIQKLYYFNWPLSLNYSPGKNIFITAGLQFSSLQSGLVRIDRERLSGPPMADNDRTTLIRFKDDSVAASVSPAEWRWETGVNYYLSRFTVGLKYNRSFKDVVNVKPAYNLPATVSRNAAVLLYLRYNLFESRKKPVKNDVALSLIK